MSDIATASPESQANGQNLLEKVLNVLAIVFSIVLIVCISLESFQYGRHMSSSVYLAIQFWICAYFLVEFIVLLLRSESKRRFFWRYLVLVVLSVPYLFIIGHFAIDVSPEAAYLLRFLPVVRGGVALVILAGMLTHNRINSLFFSYIVLFCALIYFQTLIFYIFEVGVNHQVKTYYDVLWWAAMTVTTVGSNIIAVTPMGKASATILACIGMTTLPIFTAYISSVVQRFNHRARLD
ncbi:ion channel [Alcaligenes endophyticus]|uniref:Potassium channel family protein n=1 Tax=Alcaligenes endophyticus TaxID=1929088 RepID=A0ABT8ELP6_9BURK|nr:ion channel [Alcaligenes endophyticus]MCX5591217.1 ion channel [Alcaligenes endophyticus]MDN4122205.1 potassium channel family protein [Alcaligenes endophyticus]